MQRVSSQTRVPLLNLGDQYDDSAPSQRQVSSSRRRGVAATAGISWGGSRRWDRSQLEATPRLQTKRCATVVCLKQLRISEQSAAGNRVAVQQRRVGLVWDKMVGVKVEELEEDRGVLRWES